ncbi:MAG: cell division protein FtsL [Gammaproteobacteria bacterium]
MNQRQRILTVVTALFLAVLASAVLLVYSKHESRKKFVELGQLRDKVAALETEWGRLQLEQSAWSDHGRIEQIARTRLNMVLPESDSVVFIRP